LSPFLYIIETCFASTQIISQSAIAVITYPEPSQTILSIQVQTTGACGLKRGTACLIMFDPISALVASSCSKKGSREVSTDITCFGETSICVTCLTCEIVGTFHALADILVVVKFPNSSKSEFASATTNTFSCSASK